MIRHYLIAAWRNLMANRLQSGIAIGGLALGLAAAIIAGLLIRNAFTFDSFLPLHDRLYMVGTEITMSGRPTQHDAFTGHAEAAKLATVPGIAAVSRVGLDFEGTPLRHDQIQGQEFIYSADSNIFDLLQFHVLYGDLKNALARPDGMVIPLSIARKYFGRDNVVDQTLTVAKSHSLTITAVVEDLPSNGSNLRTAMFVSGKQVWTVLGQAVTTPAPDNDVHADTQTFVRLAPNASADAVQAGMDKIGGSLLPLPPAVKGRARLIPLGALNILPDYAPGALDRLAVFAAVALVILVLSVINFINLVMARAARRSVEIGIRKALGASRRNLVAQFLGEAMVQALVALVLALAMVEWTLPAVNAALQAGAVLTYGPYGMAAAALLMGALLVGLAAGFYPALVLSSFPPAMVLKEGPLAGSRSGLVRQILVIVQFSALAILAIGAGVLLAQYRFSLSRTLERADRVLMVAVPKCEGELKDKVSALPGVEATGCSDISFVKSVAAFTLAKLPDGTNVTLDTVTAGPGFLNMFGEGPIAGRDLNRADQSDNEPKPGDPPIHVLVNQIALRKLGISSPQAAIGHAMRWENVPVPVVIVGVVPDFSAYALEKPVAATAYINRHVPDLSPLLNVKLSNRTDKEVLAAINQDWSRTGDGSPFNSVFMKDWINEQRIGLLRESEAVGVFTGIAMLLGCLGLFGLSISAAQRRIKEIGVRKAMGAGNGAVLGLLLWQFAQPVLWANIIAWPLAFWLMRGWLNGFAYHVGMPLWLFPAAGAATLAIALFTVAAQSWTTARQKPVLALRYE